MIVQNPSGSGLAYILTFAETAVLSACFQRENQIRPVVHFCQTGQPDESPNYPVISMVCPLSGLCVPLGTPRKPDVPGDELVQNFSVK